jgi:phosphatidylinositol glycan class P protein
VVSPGFSVLTFLFGREWALLFPSWSVMVVILTYISYSALAIRATPAFNEMSSITGSEDPVNCVKVDLAHQTPPLDSRIALPSPEDGDHNPYMASAEDGFIPELYDIPIGMVNRVLYHDTLRRAYSKAQTQYESDGSRQSNLP